ncbi:MAG: hypothetical protein AAFQ98_04945 [Bacteroidota bacterium]
MSVETETIKSRLIDQLHALQDLQKLQVLEGIMESWTISDSMDVAVKQWHEPHTTKLSVEKLKNEQDYNPGGLDRTFGTLADLPQPLEALINQLED